MDAISPGKSGEPAGMIPLADPEIGMWIALFGVNKGNAAALAYLLPK